MSNGVVSFRKRGTPLTQEQREEFGLQAYEAHIIQRKSIEQTCKEVGVGRVTCKKLIAQVITENRRTFKDRLAQQIATYEHVIKLAFETHMALVNARNLTSQNRITSLTAITNALARIDILLGLEASRKLDVTTRVGQADLSDVPTEKLEKIVEAEEALEALMAGVVQGEG